MVEYTGEHGQGQAWSSRQSQLDVVEGESGVIGRACEEGLRKKLDTADRQEERFLCRKRCRCGLGAFVWSTVLATRRQDESGTEELGRLLERQQISRKRACQGCPLNTDSR